MRYMLEDPAEMTLDQRRCEIAAILDRGVHDPRIPIPGSLLTRRYKDCDIVIKVLPKGFEFEGELYRSISAVVKAITGAHWNGIPFRSSRSRSSSTPARRWAG